MRLFVYTREEDWLEAALAVFEEAAAARRAEAAREARAGLAAAARGAAPALHFCLAGGGTPAGLYRLLSASPRAALAFKDLAVHLWLGDEREVGPSDPSRNGGLVEACFATAVWKPRLHLWPASAAGPASEAYGRELAAELGETPVFDLCLLGLGNDGHTASLFPGDPILEQGQVLAAPSISPLPPHGRMSLTYRALGSARLIRFLVRGADKGAVVAALAAGKNAGDGRPYPASGLDSERTAILYLSEAGAPGAPRQA